MRPAAVTVCSVVMMLMLQATAWAVVDWSAPADCPAAATVNARIDALAGAPPDGLWFTATVKVVHDPKAAQAWKVHIQTSLAAAKGERTFEGASCEAVTNATVVFITLMLTERAPPPMPEPARSTSVPARATSAPARAIPVQVPPTSPAKTAELETLGVVEAKPALRRPDVPLDFTAVAKYPPNRRRWHGRMHLGAAHNELAKTTANVGLTAGLSWQRRPAWAIELGVGAAMPSSTQPFANQPWVGITHLLFDSHLGPCVQSRGERLLLRGCSTVGVQFVRLMSDGISQPGGGSALVPTVGAKLVLGWRLNANWLLVVNSSIDLRLAQPSFAVPPWGPVWSAPRTVFHTGVGFEWRR